MGQKVIFHLNLAAMGYGGERDTHLEEIKSEENYKLFDDINDELSRKAKELNVYFPSTVKNITTQIFNAQEAEAILYTFPINLIKLNDNDQSFIISIDIPYVNNQMIFECIETYLIIRINNLVIDLGLYGEVGDITFNEVSKNIKFDGFVKRVLIKYLKLCIIKKFCLLFL